MTSMQLKILAAPSGWEWATRPTLKVSGAIRKTGARRYGRWGIQTYQKDMKALAEWAIKHELGVAPMTSNYYEFQYDERQAYDQFKVTANKVSITKSYLGDWTCTWCANRNRPGEACPIGTITCSQGHKQKCQGCLLTGARLFPVRRAVGGVIALCANCAPTCTKAGCSNRIYHREMGVEQKGLCTECSPVFRCNTCERWAPKDTAKKAHSHGEEVEICGDCADKYSCSECNAYVPRKLVIGKNGSKVCQSCKSAELDEERVKHEKFTTSELPLGGSLVVESLPSRPFRTVSIETEVDGDKDILAGVLHRAGLVRVGEVEGYHAHADLNEAWAAFLKHDGSVSGGELISWCMNLDEKPQADALLKTLGQLRSLEKINKIQYNANCGGHIHIDAHNFGIGDVWRLMTIWNYLEDVIYRLAGAGHPYSHRTLVPGHDNANGGGGYAGKPVKGPFGTKGRLHQSVAAQVRMSGLNFKPYFAALNNCGCTQGVGYDNDGRHCDCNLGKCTIEWRVWNSQGNPRILHAWIAFMQAMHAYADQGIDPDPKFEEDHPAHEYTNTKFATCNAVFKSEAKDRLRWIFRNLTFTSSERDSLVYAFKQSELKELGDAFYRELLDIVPEAAYPVKSAPRNPAKRSCAIAIRPLKKGEPIKLVDRQGALTARLRREVPRAAPRAVVNGAGNGVQAMNQAGINQLWQNVNGVR